MTLCFPFYTYRFQILEITTTADPVISIVKDRQYVDWRPIRYLDVNSTDVKRAVGEFCSVISKKLRLPWLTPEERQAIEEQRRERNIGIQRAEAKKQAEEQESFRISTAKKQAEEERRQRDEKEKSQAEDAERQRTAEPPTDDPHDGLQGLEATKRLRKIDELISKFFQPIKSKLEKDNRIWRLILPRQNSKPSSPEYKTAVSVRKIFYFLIMMK